MCMLQGWPRAAFDGMRPRIDNDRLSVCSARWSFVGAAERNGGAVAL